MLHYTLILRYNIIILRTLCKRDTGYDCLGGKIFTLDNIFQFYISRALYFKFLNIIVVYLGAG